MTTADVLVVGAGPAGATAAAALAERGIQVLLAGPADPTGADHDLMLSGPARRGLARIGADRVLPVRPAAEVRLHIDGDAGRTVADAHLATCAPDALLEALREVAVKAGTGLIPGRVDGLERAADGWHAMVGGEAVAARHVVMATGALPGSEHRRYGRITVRRFEGAVPDGRLLLGLAGTGGERPACVWALPGAGHTVTIGAAVMGDPADVLDHATDGLPGLRAGRPAGPVSDGVFDCDYTPERVAGSEFLLVGDAAGLANSFTGEGLGYAVSSGLLAAEAIAANLADPEAARNGYARRLATRFAGYFETAHRADRRYHLTWRILSSTAGSERPFFAKARRAILLPDSPAPFPRQNDAFLVACDEVELSLIRSEWPFLARMLIEAGGSSRRRTRPALLFLAGALAAGTPIQPGHARTAAATELAIYGALAFLGQAPVPAAASRGVDWASATTVLAGDFLIAQASRLAAESGSEVSWSFAEWLAEVTSLRAARLAPDGEVAPGDVFAALFEFPARLGAMLGGSSPGGTEALRNVGRACGQAFLHAEEVLALRGERTRLDITLTTLIRDRVGGLSETVLTDPEARAAGLTGAVTGCLDAAAHALAAASEVPDAASRSILREFVQVIAAPAMIRSEPVANP
jgi:flavin-dependent dehydrogenase